MREHLRTKRRLPYLDTEASVLPLAACEVVSRHEFYQYLTAARDLKDTMEASDDPLPNIEVFYPAISPKRHRSGEAANTHAEIENNLRKVSKPVAALKGDSSPTHNVEESSSVEQEVALGGMFLSTSATYPYWDGTSVGLLGTFSDVDVRTANRLPGHLV